MPNQRCFTDDQEHDIVAAYLAGQSMARIGASYGVFGATISAVLQHHGIEPRSNGGRTRRTAADEATMVQRYLAGESVAAIGADYAITEGMVRQVLRKHGIHRQLYSLNIEAFDTSSEEADYWLGFLMADGHVEKGRLKVELNARDAGHLQSFLDFVGSDAPVVQYDRYDRRTGNTYHTAYARINSVEFVAGLRARGMTSGPRAGERRMPADIACPAAFWRGVMDGDGSLGCYRMATTTEKYYPVLELCGSQPMMEQYLAWAKTVVPVIGSQVQYEANIYKVTCTGSTAYAVIRALYDGASVALPRKRAAARDILERFVAQYKDGPRGQTGERTHCPQGHPYDAENTYVGPRGQRSCRTCRREAHRRHHHKELHAQGKEPQVLPALRTHCPQGHPYDEENTYLDSRGRRYCRICRREQWRRCARKRYQSLRGG